MSQTSENQPYRDRLQELHNRGVLTPFAWHFALTISRLAGDKPIPDHLFLAAALVAHHTVTSKHVCLAPNEIQTLEDCITADVEPDDPVSQLLDLPLPTQWVEQLQSPDCAFAIFTSPEGDSFKPLVLEEGRLYLQRYWEYENRLAKALTTRSTKPVLHAMPCEYLPEQIRSLTRLPIDDGQVVAIQNSLKNNLCVITGGPGTGKTTIISVVLTALFNANPDLHIRICAPTGKAQARAKEALQVEVDKNLNLEPDSTLRKILSELETTTIHRLLRFNPVKSAFTYSESNRFPADVLIVDEVSMVSLPLMLKLLSAAPDDCRIFLLGDKDQLAAVETGSVLADVCAAWAGTPSLAVLRTSHRFNPDRGIGKLKDAVNAGSDQAWEILASDADQLAHAPSPVSREAFASNLTAHLAQHPFREYRKAQTPREALALFDTFRILCATRHGPCGSEAANRCMQDLLGIKDYEHGYPVIVTVNDYAHRLFNGDVGMCLRDQATNLVRVWFSDFEKPGEFRSFSVAELPEHAPVFAMTVHKAQGSGFDEVLLVLPPYETPVLSRELVYTGLTRAKKRCTLWADRPIFEKAVKRVTLRLSGLAEKLSSQ